MRVRTEHQGRRLHQLEHENLFSASEPLHVHTAGRGRPIAPVIESGRQLSLFSGFTVVAIKVGDHELVTTSQWQGATCT
jgi:hypothetical protein